MYRTIKIISRGSHLCTDGLAPKHLEQELLIRKRYRSDYENVLTYIIDYVIDYSADIKPNQTLSYYSWLVMFRASNDGKYLEIHEPIDDSGERYEEGCERGLLIVEAQKTQCEILKMKPAWPLFTQQLVISAGVYEGDSIEGIRYPSPSDMCGWWLITDRYNGDINTLKTVHYYHLAFARQDILQLLALPYGYRFDTRSWNAWFDEKVAQETY